VVEPCMCETVGSILRHIKNHKSRKEKLSDVTKPSCGSTDAQWPSSGQDSTSTHTVETVGFGGNSNWDSNRGNTIYASCVTLCEDLAYLSLSYYPHNVDNKTHLM
jgi:hypothetical protein